MKKLFAFAAAAIFALSLNAKKVTFDFATDAGLAALGIEKPAAGAGTNVTTATFDGVTMTTTNGGTATRVWNSNGATTLRVYKNGGSLTFTTDDNITAIEFAGSAINFSEFSGMAWTGEAKSVKLTASANSTISSITLTIGEAAVVWKPDTVTVSEARALIEASDAHDHFVKGVVAGQAFNLFDSWKDGKVTFWLTDAAAPADSLEAYQVLGKDQAKWENLDAVWEELRVGDTVLVYAASLTKYGDVFEIGAGYYAEKLGANPNPPAIVPRKTITAAEAVEIAKTLTPAQNKSKATVDEYIVKGFVTKIKDAENKTYYLGGEPAEGYGDNFQAYQCASVDSEVALFDYVLVTGKIINYNGGSYNNYEISGGPLVHGEAPKIDTIEVTPTEALALVDTVAEDVNLPGIYAVRGFVGTAYDAEEGFQTFYVADEKGGFAKFQAFNAKVGDAPVETGWEVRVIGKLYKHGANACIKNGSVEILATEGIENVVLTEKAQKVVVDGVVYIVRDNKMFDTLGNQVR